MQFNLTELANRYRSDKGTEYFDKHGYTLIYEPLFEPLKTKSIVFLEIGLCIGGPEFGEHLLDRVPTDMPSIRIWTEYFENANIYGFDINNFSHLESEFENFEFIQGDLSSQNDLMNLIQITTQKEQQQSPMVYDIVLDDASHASFHQQQAFSILFPCLKSKGLYIIEDLNWQSPSYEEKLPNIPKTLDLLLQLKQSQNKLESIPENYFFRELILSFLDEIDSIELYCDRKLAVIKKC